MRSTTSTRPIGRAASAFAALLALTACQGPAAPHPTDLEADDLDTDAVVSSELHFLAERGPVFPMDGADYYIHGPLVDGKRDQPGHTWIKTGNSSVFGYHHNTGPFGAPSWWSSTAPDGALLYLVQGRIDTWTPQKSADYIRRGFVHYHALETLDRQRHPSKVMYMRHFAVRRFELDGGPRPWLAHSVRPGLDREFQPQAQFPYPPRERFAYVGCADKGGQDPDFISVIGLDPGDAATYGKIIDRVDLLQIGDEVHHYGYNIFQTRLLVPGLFTGRLHVLDVETDPAHPTLVAHNDDLVPDSGYIVPHTVIGLPDGGYMLTMIGANTPSTAPGGLVQIDADARFVRHIGPGPVRSPAATPPNFMYDVGINPIRNRMITTSFGLPADVAPGITVTGLGDEINVWDWQTKQLLQSVKIGAGTGALEVRWTSDEGSTIGFTNAPGTSEIWRWSDLDLDGVYDFDVAITLPPLSVPTDILLSGDDRYLYISNWAGNSVMQYDIRDPFNPILTGQVTVPYAQMMRISPDNRRLYVTNSLLSTWDDDEFPAGVTRNTGYGLWKIDLDHVNGGMTIDPNFFVDFDNVQKKNSIGPARPHQVFFDPSVRQGFGSH